MWGKGLQKRREKWKKTLLVLGRQEERRLQCRSFVSGSDNGRRRHRGAFVAVNHAIHQCTVQTTCGHQHLTAGVANHPSPPHQLPFDQGPQTPRTHLLLPLFRRHQRVDPGQTCFEINALKGRGIFETQKTEARS